MDDATRALLEYTEKLTRTPSACTQADVDELRAVGWDDKAISDAVEICAFFNYINRVADGLGVDPEEWLDEVGRAT